LVWKRIPRPVPCAGGAQGGGKFPFSIHWSSRCQVFFLLARGGRPRTKGGTREHHAAQHGTGAISFPGHGLLFHLLINPRLRSGACVSGRPRGPGLDGRYRVPRKGGEISRNRKEKSRFQRGKGTGKGRKRRKETGTTKKHQTTQTPHQKNKPNQQKRVYGAVGNGDPNRHTGREFTGSAGTVSRKVARKKGE